MQNYETLRCTIFVMTRITHKQPQPDLSQMLSEFNRSLMLIADKSLLIDNFIAKSKQLFLVDCVFVFLLDENTGRMQKDRIRKMYRTDRLATLGELAAGAAHEIRNPLTSIRSAIQYLSKDFNNDPGKSKMIAEIINEVERINKILQGLLSFARPSKLNISEINLESLINQVLMLINSSILKQNIDVQFEYFTENTSIHGDMEQLKQVFLNIFLNAIDAMSENREDLPRSLIISIEKGRAIDVGKHYLVINIEDTGKGIES